MKYPPMVSFITWNRAGTNVKNLQAILATDDDFELHIIDNNSKDNTWEFIEGLQDERIKSKTRFDKNYGILYAINYTMAKRKPEQYFITVDSDVCLLTKDWVTQFIKVMEAFPEVGYLGVMKNVDNYFKVRQITPIIRENNSVTYYQFHSIWGGCSCLRPEVIDKLGYWNEEIGRADNDMCQRVNICTTYKTGYVPTIDINHDQRIACDVCMLKDICILRQQGLNCFDIHDAQYKHVEFSQRTMDKQARYWREIKEGVRTPYCATIHDQESMEKHYYNKKWAEETFQYYIQNAN